MHKIARNKTHITVYFVILKISFIKCPILMIAMLLLNYDLLGWLSDIGCLCRVCL